MKALILAGGLGTRLRPLTYTRPKHLLPIANVPHIEHVFHLLQRHGVDHVVLLTSHLAEAFSSVVLEAQDRGMRVDITHEPEPLGTAGALRNAVEFVGSETFLAFNGDILSDMDLSSLLDLHRERSAEATIVLTPVEDPSAYGVVPTNEDGRVLGFIEKPAPGEASTKLVNAGIYVMEASVLDRIPRGRVYSAEHQLFPELAEAGRLYARAGDGYWMDIGTPQKYLQANLDALAGRYETPAVPLPANDLVLAGDGARVDPDARVSSACLGPGASVGAGAVVQRCVLLAGASVGPGARVEESILGEGAVVEAGARLSAATLADNETVE